MSISNMLRSFQHSIYIIYSVIIFVLALILTGTWFGYAWYIKSYEQAAHKDLAYNIDEYYRHFSSSIDELFLNDIKRAFEIGAKRHSHSNLYPYFLAYQADALVHLGKYNEAIEIMDKMLQAMPKKNNLYYLYAIKSALMKLDTKESKLKEQGLSLLKNFSQDENNPLRDMSLYYYALYLFYNNQKDMAQKLWQELIARSDKDSGWHQLALERIENNNE